MNASLNDKQRRLLARNGKKGLDNKSRINHDDYKIPHLLKKGVKKKKVMRTKGGKSSVGGVGGLKENIMKRRD